MVDKLDGLDQLQSLKRKIRDCYKYRAFSEGESIAEHDLVDDTTITYYRAMCLFELKRRPEALELLRNVARRFPSEIVPLASGHYLGNRLRVSEGYFHEDGWITMLEVAIASGLLPCYDYEQILNDSANHNSEGDEEPTRPEPIPRKIVQFWDKVNLPAEVLRMVDRIKAANQDFCHELHCEDSAREYIKSALGAQSVSLYEACPHAAAKADFFRVVYLYFSGGFYIDVDEVSDRSLSSCFDNRNLDFAISYTQATTSCINNWFVACAAKSPIVERVLRNIVGNLENVCRYGANTNIWVLTGPGVWTFSLIDHGMDTFAYQSGNPFRNSCFLEEKSYRRIFESPVMAYKDTPAGNWRLNS